MLFSSTVFLFLFFPIVIFIYHVLLRKREIGVKNTFLFAVSILFYAWGEPLFVFLLMLLVMLTYWGGGGSATLKKVERNFCLQYIF